MDLRRVFKNYLIFCVLLFLGGCTGTTPTVTALGTSLVPFSIVEPQIVVMSASGLENVVVTAKCYLGQTNFTLEFPDVGAWTSLSSIPLSDPLSRLPIKSVSNTCSTNQTLTITLDLSSLGYFSSMFTSNGSSRTLRFHDQNITGTSYSDDIKIVYSNVVLSQERFIFGQGNNNTIESGSYRLKGRVVNITQSEKIINSDYKLKGRVVYQ